MQAFLAQQRREQELADAIAAGKDPEFLNVVPASAAPEELAVHQSPAIEFPGVPKALLDDRLPLMTVLLEHKDMTIRLPAIDISIGDDAVGVLMPASKPLEEIKFKTKFKLVHAGISYQVVFIGGNFEFEASIPKLRVLSFARLADKLTQ